MKNIKTIFLIILISIPSIWFLLHSGFFQTDDGEWMIIRFSAFHQSLRDGQFPVRYLSRLNNGYGYPVSNFLYPGFMYLAEPIHLLGFKFVDTIKIVFGLSMISSFVFIYLWLSKFFNKIPVFIGSIFYLYAPYHLYDLYKRGSIGEVLALSVVPFVFWQIERKSFFWTTLGIGFLILSHNTLAVLFLPIIVLYMLLNILIIKKRRQLIYKYIFTLFLSLGISSFFWIPAVFDLKFTVFSQTSISNFSEYFSDLELLGLSTIAIFILFFILFITKRIDILKHRLSLFFFIIGILSLLFSINLSFSFWNFLPVSFIQFPFRLLSITILSASFLLASSLSVLSKKLQIGLGLFILFLTLFSSKPFLSQIEFFDKGDLFYSTNESTTTVKDEYMPKWVKNKPMEHFKNKVEIIDGTGKIKDLKYNSKNVNFSVTVEREVRVRVNTIYFSGWEAKVDGKEVEILKDNDKGLIEFLVSPGVHIVNTSFNETTLRFTADIIAIISFLGLVYLHFKKFSE